VDVVEKPAKHASPDDTAAYNELTVASFISLIPARFPEPNLYLYKSLHGASPESILIRGG
jgi:hypothetical protein